MAEGSAQRRLAAILAADVVGYSRLIEADEEGTRARLRSLQAELIEPQIAADGGRIVKTMGDGILVEFSSAVNAVRNAIAIQQAMSQRNAGLPDANRIEFRVGINVGDVIVEGDDIHGDGVNVAARLEGLCEPGAVYVSGTVYDQASGKLATAFEDLGEQTVKNIAKRVRVYRARVEEVVDARVNPPAMGVSSQSHEKPSIAVLPFDNLSNDPEQEYFSDGMAEDLITDISKISGLFVVARNSSFAFKGQSVDVKEIARKLGVKHVVEGSVRKMGTKLRVNAQLIDAESGGHVWAERYDGDMEEIFDFQDNIREQIVAALQVSLTASDKALTERKPTDSVEAYDLFLKGRSIFYNYTPQHFYKAIKFLEEAIEVDPYFADAYSYLAYLYLSMFMQMSPGSDGYLERASELAEKGVTIDSTSAEALARLGYIQIWELRYDQGIANSEKALALAPNNAAILASFGQALNYNGNPAKALKMFEKAFSIETVVSPVWELQSGFSYLLLRQYDQAVSRLLSAVERAPQLLHGYTYLACAYVELDRIDDARKTIDRALEVTPAYTLRYMREIAPFRMDGERNRFVNDLRIAGLPDE